jgi:hypothetical protein
MSASRKPRTQIAPYVRRSDNPLSAAAASGSSRRHAVPVRCAGSQRAMPVSCDGRPEGLHYKLKTVLV